MEMEEIYKKLYQNNWEAPTFKEVPADEWWVRSEFPYEIVQNYKIESEREIDDALETLKNVTPNAYKMALMSLNMNSTYGAYGSPSGGLNYNHPGFASYINGDGKIFKHEGVAKVRQKELLVEHHKRKLAKLPKRKPRTKNDKIDNLTKIIEQFIKEIDEYKDAYPERFI